MAILENNNKSVFSKKRTISMPYGLDIFKNKKYEFNKKYEIDGIKILNSIKDGAIPAGFFDPQYRGILDKMGYGNEGKGRGKARCELHQMPDGLIHKFMEEYSRVLMPTGHLFL
jgi:site-specific DNA-methyltransferase (adenine-specific)